MEKKQYIAPKITPCLLQSEGIMYTTSIGQGEDWNEAKRSNFSFDELDVDAPEAVYPQAKSAWVVDEQYDQW